MNNKPIYWRSTSEVHSGIENAVRQFLYRAKTESRRAREYLEIYRADTGASWAYDGYLSHRTARAHWVHAAKVLLVLTLEPGRFHHDVNMRHVRRIREGVSIDAYKNPQPSEVSA